MYVFSMHLCSSKKINANKKIYLFMHSCNQINQELYVLINK
jgi:hypothetical protein